MVKEHWQRKKTKEELMKKFLKIGAALTALVLGLVCFVACSNDDGGSTVLHATLTGSSSGYKMYDRSWNPEGYYTKGYITYNGYITSQSESVAGEFSIIGSSLRIEIYEGQTLSSNIYFYITNGSNQNIGRVDFSKTNDKLELKYQQY